MLGAANSGAMQLRGLISVVPAGHDSPGWIGVPRPPPRPPRPFVCWASSGSERTSAALKPAKTSTLRMKAPDDGNEESCPPRDARGTPVYMKLSHARRRLAVILSEAKDRYPSRQM